MSKTGRPRIYTGKDRMEIMNLSKEGYSTRKIAAVLGISKTTVHRIISEKTNA